MKQNLPLQYSCYFSSGGLFFYNAFSSHFYVKQTLLFCFCIISEATVILQVICSAMFCFCVSVCIDLGKLTLRKYSCVQKWSNLCCNEPLSGTKLNTASFYTFQQRQHRVQLFTNTTFKK